MTDYTILQPIVLGFLGQFDTQDSIISASDGHIRFDDKNIIFVDNNGVEHESVTTNNAIEVWLEQHILEARR